MTFVPVAVCTSTSLHTYEFHHCSLVHIGTMMVVEGGSGATVACTTKIPKLSGKKVEISYISKKCKPLHFWVRGPDSAQVSKIKNCETQTWLSLSKMLHARQKFRWRPCRGPSTACLA